MINTIKFSFFLNKDVKTKYMPTPLFTYGVFEEQNSFVSHWVSVSITWFSLPKVIGGTKIKCKICNWNGNCWGIFTSFRDRKLWVQRSNVNHKEVSFSGWTGRNSSAENLELDFFLIYYQGSKLLFPESRSFVFLVYLINWLNLRTPP